MESTAAAYWAIGLASGLAVIGASIGLGLTAYSALQAMARQPEMSSTIRTTMFVALGLIEALALIVFTICFVILFGKI